MLYKKKKHKKNIYSITRISFICAGYYSNKKSGRIQFKL